MYSQTWKTEGLGEQFVVRCDDYISFLFIFYSWIILFSQHKL